jgi:hypothetical protein
VELEERKDPLNPRANAGFRLNRAVPILTGVTVLVAALVLMVASAGAVLLHPFESSFDASDSPAGSFQPDKVGIDQSTGDVYVIDKANNVLDKFDSSGNYLSQIAVDGWGGSPDVAVDNSATASAGHVAIAPESGDVRVFDSSGTELFSIPATGNTTPDGAFDDNCGLAINPANGDIYVAEFGQQAIDRFDSTGTFISQVTTDFSPCDIAVDADGTIYAVSPFSSLHKLDASGTDLGVVDNTDGGTGAVNLDPSNSHVYFDRGNTFAEWDAGAANLLTVSGTGVLSGSSGIDVNATSGKVYASNGSTVAIFGANAIVPTVTTGAGSALTFNSATLNGTVNPDGVQVTDCHFDYGTSTAYELGSVPCVETPAAIGSGSADVPVHADVSSLNPETDYHFRLVATNANGGNNGQDAVLTTAPAVGAVTDPASNLTETAATLNGSVNPLGSQVTDCHFDYTDDADFQGNGFANATSVPCVEDPGAGNSPVPVHADISGLTAGTTYDYRVVATNGNGTKQATPTSFTTVAITTIATQATTDAPIGSGISDQATLSGGVNPTGTITFTAYGPDDDTCANAPAYTSDPVAVGGNGTYGNSPDFVPATAGTYRWQASYSGDPGNDPASTSCNDANETSVVAQATPTITSKATTKAVVGSEIADQASIAGGSSPTGTITFTAYGPNDANCSHAPAYTSSALTVDGSRNFANSPAFTPATAGTYRWRVSYSGDANNVAVTTPCDLNTSSEVSTVSKASPAITTQATVNAALGSPIADQATLSGGNNPTGSIVFTAYGPTDSTCSSTPVYASAAVPVSGTGDYGNSPAFTPAAAGTYRWRAFYLGDANNLGVSTPCNDANETSAVSQATPALVTAASGPVDLGNSISDQATLSGGDNPTGTITFTAYGPNDATCSSTPAYTSSPVTVNGNGDYGNSPEFTPGTAGTYRWQASYSGDANNASVSTSCNDPDEASVVNAVIVPPVVTPVPTPQGQRPTAPKKKCKKKKNRAAAAKKCKKKKK